VSSESDPYELNRRAAAVNDLSQSIGESNGSESESWNYLGHAELGALSLTQAWTSGITMASKDSLRAGTRPPSELPNAAGMTPSSWGCSSGGARQQASIDARRSAHREPPHSL
jgi:hypothetical protein